jgi:hypothetical protein
MNVRARGRSALIIAAGLWICASGPLHATENDSQATDPAVAVGSAADTSVEPAKATRHHSSRKTASKSRKSDRLAAKDANKDSKKPADEDTAKAEDAKSDATMPPAVANANAQWPSDTTTNMSNMAAQAGGVLTQMGVQPEQAAAALPDADAGNTQVVAADQLNDLDRAATDGTPPLTLAKATIDDAPAPQASSSSNSPWDQTSMIGKIFIAFGGLLTMASAVRMFIA